MHNQGEILQVRVNFQEMFTSAAKDDHNIFKVLTFLVFSCHLFQFNPSIQKQLSTLTSSLKQRCFCSHTKQGNDEAYVVAKISKLFFKSVEINAVQHDRES